MKKIITKLSIVFIILIICEFLVFNFASIISLKSNGETTLNFNKSQISGKAEITDEGYLYIPPNSSNIIVFNDLNIDISTLYIDTDINKESFTIKFSYNESTNTETLRTNGRINLIKDNYHSNYALCSFSGNVETLKFSIQTGDEEEFVIRSIVLNKPIPFNISPVRFFILFIIISFFIILTTVKFFSNPISEGNLFKYSTASVIIIFLIFVLLLSSFASNGIIEDFKHPKLNQINQELVDAFEAGQVHLMREPEDSLLSLENPYDWSQRTANKVKYAWDHCLYEGKYYSYYGIAPVLLLFLPYHLITGLYFPPVWAVFIFGTIGVLFLGLTYYLFVKKLFPKTPTNIAVSGLIITLLVCGIWYCLPIPNFYEIAQSSGFAFTAMGAYFMLASNAVTKGKISNLKATLSSFFLSLSVLCRPTLAIYCVVALIFIFMGAKKSYGGKSKKALISYLCASLIPFIVIGSVQMIYNYLRFDSIFDFGIQYSLTINDFTKTDYHTSLAIIGFYNFLFAFPKITTEFPFINSNYSTLGINGYYFTANTAAIGILFRALPVFSYIYSAKAYKLINRQKKPAILILSTCIIAPLIIIFSIWESGYGVRYCTDFYWQIIIGALAIAFVIYPKLTTSLKRICNKLMYASLLVAGIITFTQIYSYIFNASSIDFKATMLSFGRLFEFWNIM